MKTSEIAFVSVMLLFSSVALAAVGDINYCPDINKDGKVNDPDISILQAAYGKSNCPPYDCDLDNNGIISVSDIIGVSTYYGYAASTFPACSSPAQPDLLIKTISYTG